MRFEEDMAMSLGRTGVDGDGCKTSNDPIGAKGLMGMLHRREIT